MEKGRCYEFKTNFIEEQRLVELCAEISEELNVKAYLVGEQLGFILKEKISDLDISIEGMGCFSHGFKSV